MKGDKISIINFIISFIFMMLILIGFILIIINRNNFNLGISIIAASFIIFEIGMYFTHKFDVKQNELKETHYINLKGSDVSAKNDSK